MNHLAIALKELDLRLKEFKLNSKAAGVNVYSICLACEAFELGDAIRRLESAPTTSAKLILVRQLYETSLRLEYLAQCPTKHLNHLLLASKLSEKKSIRSELDEVTGSTVKSAQGAKVKKGGRCCEGIRSEPTIEQQDKKQQKVTQLEAKVRQLDAEIQKLKNQGAIEKNLERMVEFVRENCAPSCFKYLHYRNLSAYAHVQARALSNRHIQEKDGIVTAALFKPASDFEVKMTTSLPADLLVCVTSNLGKIS